MPTRLLFLTACLGLGVAALQNASAEPPKLNLLQKPAAVTLDDGPLPSTSPQGDCI